MDCELNEPLHHLHHYPFLYAWESSSPQQHQIFFRTTSVCDDPIRVFFVHPLSMLVHFLYLFVLVALMCQQFIGVMCCGSGDLWISGMGTVCGGSASMAEEWGETVGGMNTTFSFCYFLTLGKHLTRFHFSSQMGCIGLNGYLLRCVPMRCIYVNFVHHVTCEGDYSAGLVWPKDKIKHFIASPRSPDGIRAVHQLLFFNRTVLCLQLPFISSFIHFSTV